MTASFQLNHKTALAVDDVHVLEMRGELQRLAVLRARARIDPPADFSAPDVEIDQRLHAHWLGDVDARLERNAVGLELAAPVGQMLGPQAEQQPVAPDQRAVLLTA